jgi:hypothetical protein
MTHTSSLIRFWGLIILLSCAGLSAWAQRPPHSYVYDSLGRPVRVNHELLVGFAPAVINRAAVSSRTGDQGPLNNFLKPAIGSALEVQLGMRLADIYAIKLASNMTPADSIAFDNTGQPMRVDPLWSMLVLVLPADADDYAVQDILNRQSFSVVQFANLNYATSPTSGTNSSPPFLLSQGAAKPLAYPLPTRDVLTFALPTPLPASAELTILTAAGKIIRTEKHLVYQHGELTPLQTNVASLPAGRYFYRLITPNSTYQGRFEKQD